MAIKKRIYYTKSGGNSVSYLAVVRVNSGRQITKSFRNLKKAKKWEMDAKHGVHIKQIKDLTSENMRFRQLADYWFENHAKIYKSPSAIKRDEGLLRNQIFPKFGNHRIDRIFATAVTEWTKGLLHEKRLSPKTINLALDLLRKILNDAVKWNILRYHELHCVRKIPRTLKAMQYWSQDEIARFLHVCLMNEPENLPVFALPLYAGLRKGEVRGLLWDCIDFERKIIIVRRSYCAASKQLREQTKSHRIRYIPMHPELEIILKYAMSRNCTASLSSPVIKSFNWYHPSNASHRLARMAQVPIIRYHDLRHSFASTLVCNGRPLYDVQQLLGHAHPSHTQVYAHLQPGYLRAAIESLSFLRNIGDKSNSGKEMSGPQVFLKSGNG